MDIQVASVAGACYGVQRALDIAHAAAHEAEGKPVHTLGPLIHNPQVVAAFEEEGVLVADAPKEIAAGAVILRSHGVTPEVEQDLRERGLEVVDATCPFVKNAQRYAALLIDQRYQVFLVGEHGHAEVEGTAAYARGEAIIIETLEQLKTVRIKKRAGIVVQTTQSQHFLDLVVAYLLPRTTELRVFNTICAATADRQEAAAELARNVDIMIVVGGRNSGNTNRLARISAEYCTKVYHIERADEIDPSWFSLSDSVGITAGASTPFEQIEEVRKRLQQIALQV